MRLARRFDIATYLKFVKSVVFLIRTRCAILMQFTVEWLIYIWMPINIVSLNYANMKRHEFNFREAESAMVCLF